MLSSSLSASDSPPDSAFVSYLHSHLRTSKARVLFFKIDKAAAFAKPAPSNTFTRKGKSSALHLICVPYLLIYENVNAWWIYIDTMELNINSADSPKSHLVLKNQTDGTHLHIITLFFLTPFALPLSCHLRFVTHYGQKHAFSVSSMCILWGNVINI